MTDRERLEAIDLVRSRCGVSMEHAREVLEACDWDAVEAVIRLGERTPPPRARVAARIRAALQRLGDALEQMWERGSAMRILVRDSAGRQIATIPVNFALVAVLLAPNFVVLCAAAALIFGHTFRVVTEEPDQDPQAEASAPQEPPPAPEDGGDGAAEHAAADGAGADSAASGSTAADPEAPAPEAEAEGRSGNRARRTSASRQNRKRGDL